jgi:hypothetical protein
LGIWAALELALALLVLALAVSLGLDLRALLGGMSFLMAVAALLIEEERTDDLAIWSLLVLDEV